MLDPKKVQAFKIVITVDGQEKVLLQYSKKYCGPLWKTIVQGLNIFANFEIF